MRVSLAVVFALVAVLGCRPGPTDLRTVLNVSGDGTTGLEGTIQRGPVTPACQVDVPCDAPFAYGFQVVMGPLVVSHFQSDSVGHYRILLAPGAYGIRPDSGAAVWPPDQTDKVTVGPTGMTRQDLLFDTGIR